MPGRTATRATRTTRTTRTAASTKSARSSTIEIPDEGPVTSLRTRVVQVFSDAQKTTATQRKLVVTLRKMQEECCFEPPPTTKKGKKAQEEEEEEFDERDFNQEIVRNVLRVMNVKKSEAAGDRVIRFLAMFLKYASEKDSKIYAAVMETEDEGSQEPTNRLNRQIISILVRLLPSKDKTVRFRATQTITTLLNSLQQIDVDLFSLIRMGLTKRLRDKEAAVRVQAVMGLGRMDGDDDDEDEDDSDDEAGTILDKLVSIMGTDPDAQVRRTILANIPNTGSALHFKLERARDTDPATRRHVYTKLLPNIGDFRYLSLVEREKLIRWGLRDRDDTVRKAAARLFYERWIEDCASKRDERPEEEKARDVTAPPSREALCELLERVDIVNAGAEDGMAHEAMKQFWAGRPDYLEAMSFDHDFWLNLDPPAAFIVRSLNDFGPGTDDDRVRELIEEKMLDITQFTVILKKELNNVTAVLRKDALLSEDDPEADEMGELLQDSMFVTEQLLHLSLSLDFADEMGRRQMYSITRDAIADPALPEECTKLAIEVLRVVCGNRGESDFCAVVMEAIQDVRDTLLDDDDETTEVLDDAESFHSAQSEHDSPPPASQKAAKPAKILSPEEEEEKLERETNVHSKCLHLVQCTLQNVTCNLETNTNLTSMLNTLIIPAVQSRDNHIIREQGIICLGIAALLSMDLATSNLELFFHCFFKGHDALKEIVLQILSDVIITHPNLLAPPAADPDVTEQSELPEQNPLLRPLVKVLLRGINSDNARVAQIACEAAQKLVFHNLLPVEAIEEIVKTFTQKYFNPDTDLNPALRQGLAYFLPVFCHSKIKNAQIMAGVAVPVISKLLVSRDEIEEDEDAEMVGWPAITAHFADWTDGRKVVGQTEAGLDGKISFSADSELPHLALAVDILERALTSTCSKDERKPLLSLLTKLHISATTPNSKEGENAGHELLETLQGLVSEAVEESIGVDATQRNALAKLDATLTKRLGDVANATVVQEDLEDTVTPETANPSETPAEGPRSSVARSSVAPSVDGSEMEVDEDDTMLAGMQGEGTRMPLEVEDSDDDDESTPRASRVRATREAAEKTEADIMDELLASDEEMTM